MEAYRMHNQRSFDYMAAYLGGGNEEVSASRGFQFQSMPHSLSFFR